MRHLMPGPNGSGGPYRHLKLVSASTCMQHSADAEQHTDAARGLVAAGRRARLARVNGKAICAAPASVVRAPASCRAGAISHWLTNKQPQRIWTSMAQVARVRTFAALAARAPAVGARFVGSVDLARLALAGREACARQGLCTWCGACVRN
jgi:hypothetical protein